jgi:hypothetical protein
MLLPAILVLVPYILGLFLGLRLVLCSLEIENIYMENVLYYCNEEFDNKFVVFENG